MSHLCTTTHEPMSRSWNPVTNYHWSPRKCSLERGRSAGNKHQISRLQQKVRDRPTRPGIRQQHANAALLCRPPGWEPPDGLGNRCGGGWYVDLKVACHL